MTYRVSCLEAHLQPQTFSSCPLAVHASRLPIIRIAFSHQISCCFAYAIQLECKEQVDEKESEIYTMERYEDMAVVVTHHRLCVSMTCIVRRFCWCQTWRFSDFPAYHIILLSPFNGYIVLSFSCCVQCIAASLSKCVSISACQDF